MNTPVVPDSLSRVVGSYRAHLTGTIIAGIDEARQCFSGLYVLTFGVAGNWSWRGWKPFGFGNVELIDFDYRPAVVTRLFRQTPAAI